jgi:hypothetical protein
VIAFVLERKLKELSRLNGGYVCRERRDEPGQRALEEIAIALAGGEAPYLCGDWTTNCQHDQQFIESIVGKHFQSHEGHVVNRLVIDVRSCVKCALSQLRDVVFVLAHKLSCCEGVLSGEDAEAIIRVNLPSNAVGLCQCLGMLLR